MEMCESVHNVHLKDSAQGVDTFARAKQKHGHEFS